METVRQQLEAKYGSAPARVPSNSVRAQLEAKYNSAPVLPPEKTFGQKVSGGIQKIFPGQKVGQAIGTLAGYALTPKENRKYYDTSAPSVGQVLGDVAQGALTVGTAGGVRTGLQGVSKVGKIAGVGSNALNKVTIETAKTVGGRALQNTAIGAGFGLTGGIKEKQSVKDTLKSTALGAVTGLGAGLVIDGAIGAYGAIKKTPQKAVMKTEKELLKIENNYQKLRKNAKFSKDGNAATRKRIAQTGVMSDAVDDTGTIITDKIIPRYKALSPINNTENVVRKNLERLGETVDLNTVEKKLLQSVYDSGLQGANLDTAVNTVKKEIAGYRLRANPDGRVPLTLMHDAKIDVYNSIDFNTPAEIKAYKKALAKGLKEIVEENSNFNVKEVNESLAPYLKDVEYLESLNGRKVKGGKLGKYSARIAGNIAGGIAGGSVGGLPGSAVGTIVGGEVGDVVQGKILKGTFGNTAENALPESKILKKAVQTGNSPRPQLPAPKPGQPRIQQVSGKVINLPKRTQSAVDAQSLANLTAQKIAPPSKIPSKVSMAKSVTPKKLPSNPTTSIQKAKASGVSFDEWVKGQGEVLYHGTSAKFLPENIKPTKGTQGTGIYLDLKKDTAIRYAKGGDVLEFSGQNLKLADNTKFTKEQSQQFSESYEKAVKQLGEHSDEATNMAYKSMGFDGKKITDTEVMLFDNSKLKTRSQLKAEWDKVAGVADDLTSSIQKAKASGQSFDEWVKGIKNDFIKEQGYEPSSMEVVDRWFQAKQTQPFIGLGGQNPEFFANRPSLADLPKNEISKYLKFTPEGKAIYYRGIDKNVKTRGIRWGDFISPDKGKASFYGKVERYELDPKYVKQLGDLEAVYLNEADKLKAPTPKSFSQLKAEWDKVK